MSTIVDHLHDLQEAAEIKNNPRAASRNRKIYLATAVAGLGLWAAEAGLFNTDYRNTAIGMIIADKPLAAACYLSRKRYKQELQEYEESRNKEQ